MHNNFKTRLFADTVIYVSKIFHYNCIILQSYRDIETKEKEEG